jgi:hypothetical protein
MIAKKDIDHLQWIYDRLVNRFGEYENVDYMLKLKSIIDQLHQEAAEEAEFNRLSDEAMKVTENADEYLRSEGLDPEKIAENGVTFVNNLVKRIKAEQLVKDLWQLWESMAECGELHIGPKFSAQYKELKKRVNEK